MKLGDATFSHSRFEQRCSWYGLDEPECGCMIYPSV